MKSFNDLKKNLSENDIDQIVAIVGNRCRHPAKSRLRSIITYSPSMIPVYGIFSRLIKENGSWCYVAGQSYPDEIRTLREIILKGK